jgi:hypothetical protein
MMPGSNTTRIMQEKGKRVPKKMKVFFLSGISLSGISLARPSCLCHLAGQVK